jgi:FkbM family methyltransferase
VTLARLKWIYRAWRYRRLLERQEIRLLLQHLRPGDIAVDVGAHKGAYAYWMRRAVGAEGRVVAFEPQPLLARALATLAAESGFTNLRVENRALSSSAGTMALSVPGESTSPGASLEPAAGAGGPPRRTYPVAVTTLDTYFTGDDRRRIRLLKCDAEGHELEVFKGGRRLLAEVRPCLLFECEGRHRSSGSVDEVFRWLADLGYRGFYIDRGGARDIADFDPSRHQADSGARDYVNNFLFLPPAAAQPATPAEAAA